MDKQMHQYDTFVQNKLLDNSYLLLVILDDVIFGWLQRSLLSFIFVWNQRRVVQKRLMNFQ